MTPPPQDVLFPSRCACGNKTLLSRENIALSFDPVRMNLMGFQGLSVHSDFPLLLQGHPVTSADNLDHQKWGTQWWNASTILQFTSEPSQWRTSQPNMPPVLKLETLPLIQCGAQILSLSFRPSVTQLWIQRPHFIPWPFYMSFLVF